MRTPHPPSDSRQVKVRLSVPLVDRLKAIAETNRRSMNAEIVLRLTSSFVGTPDASSGEGVGRADPSNADGVVDDTTPLPGGARTTGTPIDVSVTGSVPDIVGGLDIDRLDRLTAIVDRTRLALGAAAARALWLKLGLPLLRTSSRRSGTEGQGPDLLSLLDAPGDRGALPTSPPLQPFEAKLPREYVSAFMRECCQLDPKAELPAAIFREAYVAWAVKTGAPILQQTVLGKFAIGLGLRGRKSKGVTLYLGCRLGNAVERRGSVSGSSSWSSFG